MLSGRVYGESRLVRLMFRGCGTVAGNVGNRSSHGGDKMAEAFGYLLQPGIAGSVSLSSHVGHGPTPMPDGSGPSVGEGGAVR